MEYQERKRWRKDMNIALVMLIIALAGICVSKFYLNPKYEELKDQIDQTSIIAQRISATNEEAAQLEKVLSKSGKEFASLKENRDELIAYLGALAQENDLSINKMTVGDILPKSKLYSLNTEIEVQGELYNIKNFIHELNASEKVARILSLSYRVRTGNDKTMPKWMWRNIDDTQLIDWWDTSTDNALIIGSNTEQAVANTGLTADELMEHGTALCYLDVEFLGTGGD